MAFLDRLRQGIAKAAQKQGEIFFTKPGERRRIRFLTEFNDGVVVMFHDSYQRRLQVPCLYETFGEVLGERIPCRYCEEGETPRDQYLWSIYDYDAKQRRIMKYKVTRATPIFQLMGLFETYKTLLNRDIEITQQGEGTQKSFLVIPADPTPFRERGVRPHTRKELLQTVCVATADPEDLDVLRKVFEALDDDLRVLEEAGNDGSEDEPQPTAPKKKAESESWVKKSSPSLKEKEREGAGGKKPSWLDAAEQELGEYDAEALKKFLDDEDDEAEQ